MIRCSIRSASHCHWQTHSYNTYYSACSSLPRAPLSRSDLLLGSVEELSDAPSASAELVEPDIGGNVSRAPLRGGENVCVTIFAQFHEKQRVRKSTGKAAVLTFNYHLKQLVEAASQAQRFGHAGCQHHLAWQMYLDMAEIQARWRCPEVPLGKRLRKASQRVDKRLHIFNLLAVPFPDLSAQCIDTVKCLQLDLTKSFIGLSD